MEWLGAGSTARTNCPSPQTSAKLPCMCNTGSDITSSYPPPSVSSSGASRLQTYDMACETGRVDGWNHSLGDWEDMVGSLFPLEEGGFWRA